MHDLTNVLAAARTEELRAQATADRLRAVLDCCRRSVPGRAADALVQWLRRGQLGPGYTCC